MVPDRGIRSRWGVVITLIGYIALVGYAVLAQPEYRSPIAQPGHAVQAEADRKSEDNQPPPYPVTTLKAFRAAEDAGAADCGTSEECRTEQRDYSDLQAQWEAAKGAQGQLQFARWQTWIAGLGTALVAIALYYTAKATRAALEANKINRESYLADQRPWVSVDAAIGGDLIWNENGANFSFDFALKNVGKTPAISASVDVSVLIKIGKMRFEEDQSAFADTCKKHGRVMGFTIFPDQAIDIGQGLSKSNQEVEDAAREIGPNNDKIFPILIGQATYYASGETEPHQTGFIYQIMRIKNGRPTMAISRGDGDIPANQLLLQHWHKPGRVD